MEPWRLIMEPWRLENGAVRLKMWSSGAMDWTVCRPVVKDSHHYEELDLDPQVKSRILIPNNEMRILRNTAELYPDRYEAA
jgi:hypothetical protein